MTGRKLYTVWYRDDFYVQIGIDWDFPGIEDRIVSIASTYILLPYNTDTTPETCLADFLKITAGKLSAYRRRGICVEDCLIEIFEKHKLRLDGKDGITLCKFEIPKWPMSSDFLITDIEDCKDSFCPDNRINKDIYDPMGIEPSY